MRAFPPVWVASLMDDYLMALFPPALNCGDGCVNLFSPPCADCCHCACRVPHGDSCITSITAGCRGGAGAEFSSPRAITRRSRRLSTPSVWREEGDKRTYGQTLSETQGFYAPQNEASKCSTSLSQCFS